jgi:hypothetical protein
VALSAASSARRRSAVSSGGENPIVLKEWPIELFNGARYDLVSDASTADAVEAPSWWMIASIEQMANGGDSAAAATAADISLTLRDATRDAVSPDFEAADIDVIASAITRLLIGRDTLIHESIPPWARTT